MMAAEVLYLTRVRFGAEREITHGTAMFADGEFHLQGWNGR
jgi:hypothetical protein